ncbi:hypothetical protein [Sulfurovum sp.]|uniref:hypothetical protein n=1 Tax=Sulfurovum sp. TaxID=1969726 RepID=UPI0025D17771|nr:hypothetical protein [Sulfurovum sp.]
MLDFISIQTTVIFNPTPDGLTYLEVESSVVECCALTTPKHQMQNNSIPAIGVVGGQHPTLSLLAKV